MDLTAMHLENVDWLYVAVLALIVFISTLLGTLLAFRHHFFGALLSALLFAAGFVFWSYYPHGLPLPTKMAVKGPVAPPPSAAPAAAPVKPANPVTDITQPPPPANPAPAPAKPQ